MKKVTIITLSLICIALTYFVIKAKAAPQNAGHEYVYIYWSGLGSKVNIISTEKGESKEEMTDKSILGVLKKVKEYEGQGWKLEATYTAGAFLLKKQN